MRHNVAEGDRLREAAARSDVSPVAATRAAVVADLERIDTTGQGTQLGAVECRRAAEHRNHCRARGRHWRHVTADSSFTEPITFC